MLTDYQKWERFDEDAAAAQTDAQDAAEAVERAANKRLQTTTETLKGYVQQLKDGKQQLESQARAAELRSKSKRRPRQSAAVPTPEDSSRKLGVMERSRVATEALLCSFERATELLEDDPGAAKQLLLNGKSHIETVVDGMEDLESDADMLQALYHIFVLLAKLELRLGEAAASADACKEAILLPNQSHETEAWGLRGEAYEAMGMPLLAEIHARKVLQLENGNVSNLDYQFADRRADEPRGVEQPAYDEIAAEDGGVATLFATMRQEYAAARNLFEEQFLDGAIIRFQRVLRILDVLDNASSDEGGRRHTPMSRRIRWECLFALSACGTILSKHASLVMALECTSKAIELCDEVFPNEPERRIRCLVRRARILQDQRSFDAAAEALRTADDAVAALGGDEWMHQEVAQLLSHLAFLKDRLGRKSVAISTRP